MERLRLGDIEPGSIIAQTWLWKTNSNPKHKPIKYIKLDRGSRTELLHLGPGEFLAEDEHLVVPIAGRSSIGYKEHSDLKFNLIDIDLFHNEMCVLRCWDGLHWLTPDPILMMEGKFTNEILFRDIPIGIFFMFDDLRAPFYLLNDRACITISGGGVLDVQKDIRQDAKAFLLTPQFYFNERNIS